MSNTITWCLSKPSISKGNLANFEIEYVAYEMQLAIGNEIAAREAEKEELLCRVRELDNSTALAISGCLLGAISEDLIALPSDPQERELISV
jgi:hypothetical protein